MLKIVKQILTHIVSYYNPSAKVISIIGSAWTKNLHGVIIDTTQSSFTHLSKSRDTVPLMHMHKNLRSSV